jgi:hypothetical protein
VRSELRLRTWIDLTDLRRVGKRNRLWLEYADIDTGASLGLFPERVWRKFDPSRVRLLPPPAGWTHQPLTIAGGRYGYDLAEVPVGLRGEDEWGRIIRLPDVTLVTQFLYDGGAWTNNSILGLSAGAFDRHWLWMHPLADPYYHNHYPADTGVNRQEWWLGESGTPMPTISSPRHV